jgi:hypothetical protein
MLVGAGALQDFKGLTAAAKFHASIAGLNRGRKQVVQASLRTNVLLSSFRGHSPPAGPPKTVLIGMADLAPI